MNQEKKDKQKKHSLNLSQALTIMLVIGMALIAFFALYRLDSITKSIANILRILAPVIYGIGIAYILNPMVGFFEEKITNLLSKKLNNKKKVRKIGRSAGISIALAVTLAILFVLFSLVIPELIATIYSLIVAIPEQMTEFEKYITGFIDSNSQYATIIQTVIISVSDWFENWLKNDLLKQITGITTKILNAFNVIVDIVLGFIISVYVLSSKERCVSKSKRIVYAVFSTEKANQILNIARKSNYIFSGFISGKIIDSLIIGILCFIGISILNIPYTLLVSVIVGVTNVIPFFGPYIGAIPSAFLILLADPVKGLYFIIFIIFLQQIDGNIIGPKILGEFTGLSAFWVVFAILLGGGLFGFVGMLLGVPVFAVIYYIAGQVIEHLLVKKRLPIQEELYENLHHIEDDLTFLSINDMENVEEKKD